MSRVNTLKIFSMPQVGPTLPPEHSKKRKISHPSSSSPPQKRSRSSSPSSTLPERRAIGPALPPADLSELPPYSPNHAPDSDLDSDSSDDFGPAPPPAAGSIESEQERIRQRNLAQATSDTSDSNKSAKPAREEWMLLPPSADGLSSSRMDPTKIRNRKFNTGVGAKAPPSSRPSDGEDGSGIARTWTETPEQKRQRLADEVMGVSRPANQPSSGSNGTASSTSPLARDVRQQEANREAERRIREYNEQTKRGGSLVSEHQSSEKKRRQKGEEGEEEDDPSARAFDKEKDMKVGGQIGHVQKREMLRKARDMGSRFSGGSYL